MYYRPSAVVTEILSNFFEFDEKQLQIGVWNGDLKLSDVNLRQDAFFSLLNPSTDDNKSDENGSSDKFSTNKSTEKDGDNEQEFLDKERTKKSTKNRLRKDVQVHLLSGKVGSFNLKVPWVLLLNGYGKVDVSISDVEIVLGFQSATSDSELVEYLQNLKEPTCGDDNNNMYTYEQYEEQHLSISEDEKQRQIAEAEMCLENGRNIPNYFNMSNRFDPIHHDEDVNENGGAETNNDAENKTSSAVSDGFLSRMMKGIASSLMWRSLCGLHVSIKNIRVVVIIDGVEFGFNVDSLVIEDKPLKNLTSSHINTANTTNISIPTASMPSNFDDLGKNPLSSSTHGQRRQKRKHNRNESRAPTPPLAPSSKKKQQQISTHQRNSTLAKDIHVSGLGLYIRQFYSSSVEGMKRTTNLNNIVDYKIGNSEHLEYDFFTDANDKEEEDCTEISPSNYIIQPMNWDISLQIINSKENPKSAAVNATAEPQLQTENLQNISTVATTSINITQESNDDIVGTEILMDDDLEQTMRHSTDKSDNDNDSISDEDIFLDAQEEISSSSSDNDENKSIKEDLQKKVPHSISNRNASSSTTKSYTQSKSSYQTRSSTHEFIPNVNNKDPADFNIDLSFGRAKAVVSTTHIKLMNEYAASLMKVKNWRPERTIGEALKKKKSSSLSANTFNIDDHYRTYYHVPTTDMIKCKEIQRTVRQWWRYAIANVVHEIHQRKKSLGKNSSSSKSSRISFFEHTTSKIRQRKLEYIQHYTTSYLSPPSYSAVFDASRSKSIEALHRLENTLFVEQIILYRSLARSLSSRNTRTFTVKNKRISYSSPTTLPQYNNIGSPGVAHIPIRQSRDRKFVSHGSSITKPVMMTQKQSTLGSKFYTIKEDQTLSSTLTSKNKKNQDNNISFTTRATYSISMSLEAFEFLLCNNNRISHDDSKGYENTSSYSTAVNDKDVPFEIILKLSFDTMNAFAYGTSKFEKHFSFTINSVTAIGLSESIILYSSPPEKEATGIGKLPLSSKKTDDLSDNDEGNQFSDTSTNCDQREIYHQSRFLSISLLSKFIEGNTLTHVKNPLATESRNKSHPEAIDTCDTDVKQSIRTTQTHGNICKLYLNAHSHTFEAVASCFIADSTTAFPNPQNLLPIMDDVQIKTLLAKQKGRLSTSLSSSHGNVDGNLSYSYTDFCLDGFELTIPLQEENEHDKMGTGDYHSNVSDESLLSSIMKLQIENMEFCTGNPEFPTNRYVENCPVIEESSNSFKQNQDIPLRLQRKSNTTYNSGAFPFSEVYEQCIEKIEEEQSEEYDVSKLKYLNIHQLIKSSDSKPPSNARHSLLLINGVELDIIELKNETRLSVIRDKIDFEILVSSNSVLSDDLVDSDGIALKQKIEISSSPIEIILSEHRLGYVHRLAKSISFVSNPSKDLNTCSIEEDRYDNSASLFQEINWTCNRLQVSFLHDYNNNKTDNGTEMSITKDEDRILLLSREGLPVREFILEECISDFLSKYACYDLSKDIIHLGDEKEEKSESLKSLILICKDRICALGVSETDATTSIENARISFLKDMKRFIYNPSLSSSIRSSSRYFMRSPSSSSARKAPSGLEQNEYTGDPKACEQDVESIFSFSTREHEGSDSSSDGLIGQHSVGESGMDDDSNDSDSKESLTEAIENAITNAVDCALSFLSTIFDNEGLSCEFLEQIFVVEVNSLVLSSQKLSSKREQKKLSLNAHSFCGRNGSGIKFLELLPSKPTRSGSDLFESNDHHHQDSAGLSSSATTPTSNNHEKNSKKKQKHKDASPRDDMYRDFFPKDDEEVEFDKLFSRASISPIPMNQSRDNHGIYLSNFETNSYSEEVPNITVRSHSVCLLQICNINFVSSDWVNVGHLIKSSLAPFGNERKETFDNGDHNDSRRTKVQSFNGHIKSTNMLFLSDSLAPFMIFKLGNSLIQRNTYNSNKDTTTSVKSKTASMYNLAPEGGVLFSKVISSLEKDIYSSYRNNDFSFDSIKDNETTFELVFNGHEDFWNTPGELTITLKRIKFLLLRQFLNEFLQYFFNPDYGIGYILNLRYDPTLLDSFGKPPPPLHYNISILNSDIILPRDGESTEVIAVQSEKVSIFNSCEEKTWSIPNEKSNVDISEDNPKEEDCEQDVSSLNHDDDSFFECLPIPSSPHSSFNKERKSSFHNRPIRRINVHVTKANFFAGTARTLEMAYLGGGNSDSVDVAAAYVESGIQLIPFEIKEGSSIYNESPKHKRHYNSGKLSKREHTRRNMSPENRAIVDELLDRTWERITVEPIDLEVVADYAPHLRLLFSDYIRNKNNQSTTCGLCFDMRMSQYYLLLSVWYANMQELPIMFPYTEEEILNAATFPDVPHDWPEYGTDSWVERVKHQNSNDTINHEQNSTNVSLKHEFGMNFRKFSLNCSFDLPGYFSKDPWFLPLLYSTDFIHQEITHLPGMTLSFRKMLLHVVGDSDGLLRLGCTATNFTVDDNRSHTTSFRHALIISADRDGDDITDKGNTTWCDINWGLGCGRHTLTEDLPLPFQLSLFLTPDRWCNVTLGVQKIKGVLKELSLIWLMLDYFGLYFKHKDYGHPYFIAEEQKNIFKNSGTNINEGVEKEPTECMNLDIRLWFRNPYLILPSDPLNVSLPGVLLTSSSGGIFYQYRSIGEHFSMQELCSKDASLIKLSGGLNENQYDHETIIKKISFLFKYDFNTRTNHYNMTLYLPLLEKDFEHTQLHGIESSDIKSKHLVLPPSFVVGPGIEPIGNLGESICDITGNFDSLKLAVDVFTSFIATPDIPENLSKLAPNAIDLNQDPLSGTSTEYTFCITSFVSGLRILLSDTVLSTHLPLVNLCIPSMALSASQLPKTPDTETNDLQVGVDVNIWANYWNMNIKSWEPLIEPYRCLVLYEDSSVRGRGLTFHSESPFHVNVTSALFETLDQASNSFSSFINMWSSSNTENNNIPDDSSEKQTVLQNTPRSDLNTQLSPLKTKRSIKERLHSSKDTHMTVLHKVNSSFGFNEKVAFSLLNLTGEKIRTHQPSVAASSLFYIDHSDRAKLNFEATISVPLNLSLAEVPFDHAFGSEVLSQYSEHKDDLDFHERKSNLVVDVQVPGFHWIPNIDLGVIGRRFETLHPLSPVVKEKINTDWRLGNATKLLTETISYNGGRQISLRSSFEIINKTYHPIFMAVHPNPVHRPIDKSLINDPNKWSDYELEESIECIEPNDTYNVPMLLLESALHLDGNHLGSVWLSPGHGDDFFEQLDSIFNYVSHEDSHDKKSVGFSSRPIQLGNIVHETSVMFDEFHSEQTDEFTRDSGLQISCPVRDSSGARAVFPFCYVVEIQRNALSPTDIPSIEKENTTEQSKKLPGTKGDETKEAEDLSVFSGVSEEKTKKHVNRSKHQKKSKGNQIHPPIAYSLVVHPPIIIENMLPEGGTFELIHATRRVVLWGAFLESGKKAHIHTVGLDAPLLLFVNLGYCRTHGNGALIHDGKKSRKKGDGTQNVWKPLVKKVNDEAERFAKFKSRRKKKSKLSKSKKKHKRLGLDTDEPDVLVKDMEKNITENTNSFGSSDIANETIVVDRVGQKLSLHINNVVGGGGQRHVSIYCPYWIVNLTEYALRYKHESSSALVSGTRTNDQRDGSKPVDNSYRNNKEFRDKYRKRDRENNVEYSKLMDIFLKRDTIFPGSKGMLASKKRALSGTELALLMSHEHSIDIISSIGFMFNFLDNPPISQRKLSVQLLDNKYISDWSDGFSLGKNGPDFQIILTRPLLTKYFVKYAPITESIGVNQIVGMHCRDGRALEVSVLVNVAPGKLSQFTKVVQIYPRYVIVNQLERPLRIWQDSSLLHSSFTSSVNTGTDEEYESQRKFTRKPKLLGQRNYDYLFTGSGIVDDDMPSGSRAHANALHICSVRRHEALPFHLPDTRKDRQLRLDFGIYWNLSPSIPADLTGKYFLKVSRFLDPALLDHVTTRTSSLYDVILPPVESDETFGSWDGELGVWFESSLDRAEILVKGTKRGKHSFKCTDIHVGDQLIFIDGEEVGDFAETMKVLKEKMATISEQYKRKDNLNRKKSRKFLSNIGLGTSSHSGNLRIPPKQLVLTFRTVEENMRIMRESTRKEKSRHRKKKTSVQQKSRLQQSDMTINEGRASSTRSISLTKSTEIGDENVTIEMKLINQSIFYFVKSFDYDNPPYRIDNQSVGYTIYFKQRGCDGYTWGSVKPGESAMYIWEEPTRPKKLSVKAAFDQNFISNHKSRSQKEILFGADSTNRKGQEHMPKYRHTGFLNFVGDEENGFFGPNRTIKLEEIGYKEELPCPIRAGTNTEENESRLYCRVDTEGSTRVLIISEAHTSGQSDEVALLEDHLRTLNKQIYDERLKQTHFNDIHNFLSEKYSGASIQLDSPLIDVNAGRKTLMQEEEEDAVGLSAPSLPSLENITARNLEKSDIVGSEFLDVIEDQVHELSDYPEGMCISRPHQVLIQIFEAAGLNSSEVSGLCSPFCCVSFSKRNKSKWHQDIFKSSNNKRKTYFVDKTNDPKWSEQCFVFDVPRDAVDVSRGYSLRIKVFNCKITGNHSFLGRTEIQLQTLKNQHELEGWYPLTGRKNQEFKVRGSIRVRVQWIYSVPAFLDYHLQFSKRRLDEIERSKVGMEKQLRLLRDLNKKNKFTHSSKLPLSIFKDKEIQRKSKLTIVPKFTKWNIADKQRISKTLSRNIVPNSRIIVLKKKRQRIIERSPTSPLPRYEEGAERKRAMFQRSAINSPLNSVHPKNYSSFFDNSESKFFSSANEDFHQSHRRRLNVHNQWNNTQMNAKRNDLLIDGNMNSESPLYYDFQETSAQSNSLFLSCDSNSEKEQFSTSSMDNVPSIHSDPAISNNLMQSLQSIGMLYRKDTRSNVVVNRTNWKNNEDSYGQLPDYNINLLGNWNLAQAYLNDNGIKKKFLTSSKNDSSEPEITVKTRIATNALSVLSPEVIKFERESYGFSFTAQLRAVLSAFDIPQCTPTFLRDNLTSWGKGVCKSRRSFSKAAKRSFSSVKNEGGRLTIRPITALNLTDSSQGMYVKLQYGNVFQRTSTVEARVDPVWSHEEQDDSPRRFSRSFSSSSHLYESESFVNFFDGKQGDNDLIIDVEPLETSGCIYLSVCGERLNSSYEAGMLHIPIGAAIRCCSESAAQHDSYKIPIYTRWFPLMSPKDCVPLEGDMGRSLKTPDSEQIGDQFFSQKYSPCIKLSLIWEPRNIFDGDLEGNGSTTTERTGNTNSKKNETGSESDETCGAESSQKFFFSYFQAYVGGISAALIDSPQELLSFCATDLDVRFIVEKVKTHMMLGVGWCQLDHQMAAPKEPVVLAPRFSMYQKPTLQFLAIKDNLRSKSNMDSFDYVLISLQELDVRVEDSWVFALWIFVRKVLQRRQLQKIIKDGNDINDKSIEKFEMLADQLSSNLYDEEEINKPSNVKKVYIGKLELGFVKINVSYVKSASGFNMSGNSHQHFMKQDQIKATTPDVFQSFSNQSIDKDFLSLRAAKYSLGLPNFLSAFPSFTDAPVRLQSRIESHLFEPISDIGLALKGYYKTEVLRQIYKIIGSLDFVGNPTMALNSIFTGVRDFFFEPSLALLKSHQNPSELGMGVVRGTLSLVSNSASGVFGIASKISATAGHAAATLTLDRDFQMRHAENFSSSSYGKKSIGTRRILYMAYRPVEDMLKGVVGAASGVLFEPYKGAKKGGIVGLSRGFAIGTVGIFAKPLVGIFDATAHITECVHDIAKSVNILEKKIDPIRKRRLSYVFGVSNILTPFDPVCAQSSNLLQNISRNVKDNSGCKEFENEILILGEVLDMRPGIDVYLILTSLRLVVVEVRKVGGLLRPAIHAEFVFDEKKVKITSNIEVNGHEGVALCISEYLRDGDAEIGSKHHRKTPSRNIQNGFDFDAFNTLDEDEDNNENFMPAQHRTKRSYKQRKIIMGEIHHRLQLVRMHNAICCFTKEFDKLMYDGISEKFDGIIKFGMMTFQKNEFKDNISNKFGKSFYESLNKASWLVEAKSGSLQLTSDTSLSQKSLSISGNWIQNAFLRVVTNKDSPLSNNTSSENKMMSPISSLFDVDTDDLDMKKQSSSQTLPPTAKLEEQNSMKQREDFTSNLFDKEKNEESSHASIINTDNATTQNRLDTMEKMLKTILQKQNNNEDSLSNDEISKKVVATTPSVAAISSLGENLSAERDKLEKEILLQEIKNLNNELERIKLGRSENHMEHDSKSDSKKVPFSNKIKKPSIKKLFSRDK